LIGSHGPTANIDGTTTRYDVVRSGQPELMFAPGGFDASLVQSTTRPHQAAGALSEVYVHHLRSP
jgi:hypothetical protein